MQQYWISTGAILVQQLVRYYTGAVLTQCWSRTGTALEHYWNNTEVVLKQYWCSTAILEQYWNNTGTVLEHDWCSAGRVFEQNSTCEVQESGKPDARSHLRACAKPFQNRSHFSLQNGTPYPPNFLLSLTASTILDQYWSNTSAATGVVLH